MSIENELKILVKDRDNGRVVAELSTTSLPVVFGRSDQCQLMLKEYEYLSRTHGSITLDGDSIRVTDLNSRNGIYYNGQKNSDFVVSNRALFQVLNLEFYIELMSNKESLDKNLQHQSHQQDKTIKVFETSPQKRDNPFVDVNKPQLPKISNFQRDDLDIKEESSQFPSVAFSILHSQEIIDQNVRNLCLQTVISWGRDIFDVRNFYVGDSIILSGYEESPIYIPFFGKKPKKMGRFTSSGAAIIIGKNIKWNIFLNGKIISIDQLVEEKRIFQSEKTYQITLVAKEVLSVGLANDVYLHFRYVSIPRPFVKKTWIENREEFKKSIWTSGLFHLIASIFALLSAPKIEAPKIPNVPERIAKLIVEPPPQIIPPPLVKPPEKPEPEPEPEPELEPEKPLPTPVSPPKEKPKPIAKPPEIIVPKKMAQKVQQDRNDRISQKVSTPPSRPAPSTNEQMLSNLFSKAAPQNGVKNKFDSNSFKVGMNPGLKGANRGLKNFNNVLAKNSNALGGSSGSLPTSQVGKIGFSNSSAGSVTGKRGVVGGIVGAPKMVSQLNSSQGISNKEVMKVVNQYLSEVQRCYERALFNDAGLSGRIEYEWDIASSGAVTAVRIKRSDMAKADYLNDCVIKIFKKMKFPRSKNGLSTTANIGFPFGKN